MILPEKHKVLVVFDNQIDTIAYYSLSKYIGCPPDEHVKSCGPIFVYEDVECLKGFAWNPVVKKCECELGLFYNQTSGECQKCQCTGFYSQCHKSATDCNDEPYFTIGLKEQHAVADAICMTRGAEGKPQLMAADGHYNS